MKYFRIACCLVLLTLFLLSFAGCTSTLARELDWALSGVWVNKNGTVQDKRSALDFSVSGSFPIKFENRDSVEMDLVFTWPGGVIEQNDDLKKYVGNAQFADKHDNQAFYLISTWLHYTDVNDFTGISFMICPDEGFVVANLGEDYLVASTDPNADTAEIFAFYKTYVHVGK